LPAERQQPQIGDTYALRANAAQETLITRVRHACRNLLGALAETDSAGHAALLADLDQAALCGVNDEVKEYRLTVEQCRSRLATTAVAAAQCAAWVRTYLAASALSDAQRLPVATRLAHLSKILADEFTLTRDAQQHVTAAAELPKEQKGSYRLGSATDPDATYRVHDDQIDFGYNVNVAATQHFIREVHVATGAQPDPVAIPVDSIALAASPMVDGQCAQALISRPLARLAPAVLGGRAALLGRRPPACGRRVLFRFPAPPQRTNEPVTGPTLSSRRAGSLRSFCRARHCR
jgi:hypothetical protein